MVFNLSDRVISTELDAFVMGIVNCTPDSFFEGSRGGAERALELVKQGADILDLGGESTRPGAEYIEDDEEIRRLVPVIEEIRRYTDVPVSIDTRKFNVFKACYESGANILNDISSLEDDEKLADFAAEKKIPVILMHRRGKPSEMQKNTSYDDIFMEVNNYLCSRVEFAVSKGIEPSKIIVDPGIGFGKSLEGNIELIKKCGNLCGGRFSVMMALSRKTCIGEITGRTVEQRESGTLAADLIAVQNGATFVRVHDVASCIDSLRVLKSLK